MQKPEAVNNLLSVLFQVQESEVTSDLLRVGWGLFLKYKAKNFCMESILESMLFAAVESTDQSEVQVPLLPYCSNYPLKSLILTLPGPHLW